jgi:hypothetical protein
MATCSKRWTKNDQRWREDVILGEARPTVVADLGYGVMDEAMVDAATYCLVKHEEDTLCKH